MNVEIVRYDSSYKAEWDNFVERQSLNGTFLHSRKFYDHNPLNEDDDSSLLFYKKGKLICVFPANVYESNGKLTLHSYLRATYGGLVISQNTGVADLIEVYELIKQYATGSEIEQVIVRPSFAIYQKGLCGSIDYCAWQAGFKTKSREVELAIDLKSDFASSYDSSTERSIKKALKSGVVVNGEGDLGSYWNILTENLKQKHQAKPVHTLPEINKLISCVGSDKVKLFSAEFQEKTIGGVLVFIANARVAHAQYIASDFEYQDLRPLNLVIDHIAKWALENGFSYFNLGMASEPGGKTLNEGLARFKEGFGARGVLRETMYHNLEKES